MAKQSVSPHEAEIAREKLETLPPDTVRPIQDIEFTISGSGKVTSMNIGLTLEVIHNPDGTIEYRWHQF